MFEEIARDTTSGASRTARLAARRLAEAVEGSSAPDIGAFWDELVDACRELLAAAPEMAPVINLAGGVLSSAERIVLSGLPPDVARQAALVECSKVWESGESLIEDLGREGASLIPEGATVATISASESVEAILRAAKDEGREFDVLVSESRPLCEGSTMAAELARAGMGTTLVTDAALPGLVARSTVVLLGADSISEHDFVNKTGSYGLALAAREAGAACYTAALLDKLIPSALRGDPGRHRDSLEIVPDAPPALTVLNRYFEVVPLGLVRGIVTEHGMLNPAEVPARLRERAVPPALLQVMFSPPPPAEQSR